MRAAARMHCYYHPRPFLISVNVGFLGTGQAWADEIVDACVRVGVDYKKRILLGVGDNVLSNDVALRILNLPRGKCGSHIGHLDEAIVFLHLPMIQELMLANKRVFTAGGSDARRKAVAQPPYNLTRSDFNIYTNRWGTAHKVLDALLITKADETESGEDEYTCRGWQALLRFYLDAPIMNGADDTDDIVTVYQGIQNMEVLLQAIIAHQVGKDIVRIIDDCKTDGDDFPVDLSDRILSARRNWVGMSTVPRCPR
jgi:hypothetical protein